MSSKEQRGCFRSAIGFLALCSTALAPPVLANSGALEEVIVTAQKRTELLKDTPISIASFNTEELEKKGIASVADLRANVPSLQLKPHPNNSASLLIFMRGVGNADDQTTQDPSVAVYMDGVYLARSQALAMDVADIERVEVLRGPQGTLYGRNATGGAINFISVAPELNAFGFKQSLTVGSDNLLTSHTRVNVPIGDEIAVQAAYLYSKKDGFVDNRGTGADRFGDQDRSAYRIAARWQPSDALDVTYAYDRSRIGDTPAYLAQVPLYPKQGKRPSAGSPFVKNLRRFDIMADGHSLIADWALSDRLSVKSISAYRRLDSNTYPEYLTGALGPFPAISGASHDKQHQFSQEFQLLGDAFDSQLEYIVGLYYFNEKADSVGYTDIPVAQSASDTIYSTDNSAYAIYGQGTYTPELLDGRLHITAGSRWSQDQREADLQIVTLPYNAAPSAGAPGSGDKTFNNFSPSFVVSYDITSDINAYGKVVKGYKTGGYNIRASSIQRFEAGFSPEKLTSYEIGLKSMLLDNRLRLNLAAFQADYTDIQINIRSDPNSTKTDVLNAGSATINGFEADATARLGKALTIGVNYAHLNARYDKIVDVTGTDLAPVFRFTSAPKNSYNIDVDYEFPMTPIGKLVASAGYSYQSMTYSRARVDSGLYIIDDYGLLNARLALSEIPVSTGSLRVALWGKNLEDKTYYTDHNNALVPYAVFGEPRSYGLDIVYQYQ
jgi:iron complex outermembrane receptor protein